MVASQMRGGYYTPIAEARGTISPSQTLPNLDRNYDLLSSAYPPDPRSMPFADSVDRIWQRPMV